MKGMIRYYIFLAILAVVSVLAISLQFGLAQGPKADAKIVEDLDKIERLVGQYAVKENKLPSTMADIGLTGELKDRQEKNGYEYKKVNGYSYQLCATFKTDARSKSAQEDASINLKDPYYSDSPSSHKKGHQCFTYQEYSLDRYSSGGIDQNSSSLGSDDKVCGQTVPTTGEYSVQVQSLDAATKQIKVESYPNSVTYKWTTEPAVYDYQCMQMKLSDIKVGDYVDLYYSGTTVKLIQLNSEL